MTSSAHPADDGRDDLGSALAATIRAARVDRGLTVAGLAEAAGVSRAMVSRIERDEVQPTAALLARLAAALDLTLSGLIARAEGSGTRLVRAVDQPTWTDPGTGYVRRAVSPAGASPELVEVELPGGAEVTYPADVFGRVDQQIWVLSGRLRFVEGEVVHDLRRGDCLRLGDPAECTFANPGRSSCRYLVALGATR